MLQSTPAAHRLTYCQGSRDTILDIARSVAGDSEPRLAYL